MPGSSAGASSAGSVRGVRSSTPAPARAGAGTGPCAGKRMKSASREDRSMTAQDVSYANGSAIDVSKSSTATTTAPDTDSPRPGRSDACIRDSAPMPSPSTAPSNPSSMHPTLSGERGLRRLSGWRTGDRLMRRETTSRCLESRTGTVDGRPSAHARLPRTGARKVSPLVDGAWYPYSPTASRCKSSSTASTSLTASAVPPFREDRQT